MKRLLRACVAAGCTATGLMKWAERRNTGALTILNYHRVLPVSRKYEYLNPALVVTPEAFRDQCRFLARYYRVLPLTEAIRAWRDGNGQDRPLAVITFDDGYRDNFEFAAPVLDECGIHATFFVIVDLVGEKRSAWYDRLARCFKICRQERDTDRAGDVLEGLSGTSDDCTAIQRLLAHAKSLPSADRQELVARVEALAQPTGTALEDDLIMAWSQVTELAAKGHEIGSHTCTHEILTQLDDVALQYEVECSRLALEGRLNREVHAFCYPNGNTDERVHSAVASAGYTSAVTVVPGNNRPGQDPLSLHRRFIHEDRMTLPFGQRSPWLMRMELSGLADRAFGRGRRVRRCV